MLAPAREVKCPRPAHLLWWDGERWTCNCGKDFEDSDRRAEAHYHEFAGSVNNFQLER